LPVEAEILGGSTNNVFVRDSYGEATVERIDIADVDHPGTGLMILGPLIALGILFPIFPSFSDCGEKGFGTCVGTFLPFALGGLTFVWGATTYAGSVAALKDRSRSDAGERMNRGGLPRVRVTKRPVAPEPAEDAAPATGTSPAATAPVAPPQPAPAPGPSAPAATPATGGP
jgi:hypothetical protein